MATVTGGFRANWLRKIPPGGKAGKERIYPGIELVFHAPPAHFRTPGLETGAVKWHKPLLMEDFTPRGDLVDSERLEKLLARSNLRGGLQLVVHLVLLIATGVVVSTAVGTPWLIPAMIPYGVVLVFLFAPLHESIHGTAFKNRGVNETVAWLAAFVLVLPPHYFRLFHFTHHRSTQDAVYDPELL